MMGSLPISHQWSLQDVPIEFIDLKKMANRLGGQFSTGLNPSFFNVPLACCFSKELINSQFEKNSKDLSLFISLYTSQKPAESAG